MATFFFNGHERLSLVFGNPNRCAVIVGMLALLAAAALLGELNAAGWKYRFWKCIAYAAALVGLLIALSLTYSRGGFIAFIAGLVTIGLTTKIHNSYLISIFALFAIIVAILPGGIERIATIGHVKSDLSIANRVVLWKSTLAMIGDNPWKGIGLNEFYQTYSKWYQPKSSLEPYRSPVNDVLAISSYHGVFSCFLYLFVVAAILNPLLFVTRRTNDFFLAGLSASIVCYIVASLFSTFIIQIPIAAFFVFILLVSLTRLSVQRRHLLNRGWDLILVRPALLAGVVCLALLGAALAAAASLTYVPLPSPSSVFGKFDLIEPRDRHIKGTVLVMPGAWNRITCAKELLRPLAANGYRVVAFHSGPGKDRINEIVDAFAEFRGARCLIGIADDGALSLTAAARLAPAALITVGLKIEWPSGEDDPSTFATQLHCPLLIFHGTKDRIADIADARAIFRVASKAGVDAAFVEVENGDHFLTQKWPDAINAILPFLAKSYPAKK